MLLQHEGLCLSGDAAVRYARNVLGFSQEDIDEAQRNLARARERIAQKKAGHASQPTSRRREVSTDFDAQGRFRFAGVAAELKASAAGGDLGQKYAGDPHRAARALQIPIVAVSASVLAAAAGRSIYGRWMPRSRRIEISDRLSRRDEAETIAHEIAHSQGHGIDADAIAGVFARAFLNEAPKPPLLIQAEARLAWDDRLAKIARGAR
jgi:hypothetical protein